MCCMHRHPCMVQTSERTGTRNDWQTGTQRHGAYLMRVLCVWRCCTRHGTGIRAHVNSPAVITCVWDRLGSSDSGCIAESLIACVNVMCCTWCSRLVCRVVRTMTTSIASPSSPTLISDTSTTVIHDDLNLVTNTDGLTSKEREQLNRQVSEHGLAWHQHQAHAGTLR